jgi:predicted signal transduction protein with EAL and GGDEF domain
VRTATRRDDVAARVAGDEFAVLVHDVRTPGEAMAAAHRVLAAARARPVRIVPVRSPCGPASASPQPAGRKHGGLGEPGQRRHVAEGIETTGQAAEPLDLGCDIGQGYLYARPIPPAEVEALLTTHSSTGSETLSARRI